MMEPLERLPHDSDTTSQVENLTDAINKIVDYVNLLETKRLQQETRLNDLVRWYAATDYAFETHTHIVEVTDGINGVTTDIGYAVKVDPPTTKPGEDASDGN